jgi:hypothetical protein
MPGVPTPLKAEVGEWGEIARTVSRRKNHAWRFLEDWFAQSLKITHTFLVTIRLWKTYYSEEEEGRETEG